MGIFASITEGGAWLTIMKGLLTTIKISLLGLALGTILGAMFCRARTSSLK